MKVLNKWQLIISDPQEIVGLYCPRKCHNESVIHLLIHSAKGKAQEVYILNKQEICMDKNRGIFNKVSKHNMN